MMHSVAGELFQFARAQIFFAKLDIVDAGMRGFGDFGEQGAAAGAFVATKLASVGDVVEQTAVRPSAFSVLRGWRGADTLVCEIGTAVANSGLPWPRAEAEPRSAWTGEGARPHTGITEVR